MSLPPPSPHCVGCTATASPPSDAVVGSGLSLQLAAPQPRVLPPTLLCRLRAVTAVNGGTIATKAETPWLCDKLFFLKFQIRIEKILLTLKLLPSSLDLGLFIQESS